MGRSCGAFALMMSNDGKRIELILERKSFGGGTRGERYLEVRFEGGILVNNRSVDLESTFSDLIELAMEEPLFRVVEPSRGLV